MKKLKHTLIWDLKLLVRYQILTIALVVTIGYVVLFKGAKSYLSESVVTMLIFSDPAMLGFMFIGALVLFEKSAQTLSAITVTPLRIWQYLWSKVLALTLLALPCSVVMAGVGLQMAVQWHWLLLAVVLSSILYTLLGFVGVLRVKTLNQYLIVLPLFMTPLCVPLLGWLGITPEYFGYYLIPTQASLILFKASTGKVEVWELAYSIIYLGISIILTYQLAENAFIKHVRT